MSGIDILVHAPWIGKRRVQRELDGGIHLGGHIALDAIHLPSFSSTVREALAALLVALGLMCAVVSWVRWARAERAMRRSEPLPSSPLGAILTAAVVVTAVAILVVGF